MFQDCVAGYGVNGSILQGDVSPISHYIDRIERIHIQIDQAWVFTPGPAADAEDKRIVPAGVVDLGVPPGHVLAIYNGGRLDSIPRLTTPRAKSSIFCDHALCFRTSGQYLARMLCPSRFKHNADAVRKNRVAHSARFTDQLSDHRFDGHRPAAGGTAEPTPQKFQQSSSHLNGHPPDPVATPAMLASAN